MRAVNGLVVIGLCLTGLLVSYSNADVVRSKRDDADITIVTTIAEEPYVYENDGVFTGFIPDMMEKIKDEIRISYKFKLVPDKKYGQKNSGTWNGMIGQIQKDKADMAAAPMTISDERKEVVDFTEPFMTFDITVLVKKGANGSAPIKSVRDLADQTKIKYGLVKDGRTERIFEDAEDDPKFQKMWEEISGNSDNRLSSIEAGVKKVRKSNGNFAFIMERVSADYWVLKKPCELTTTAKAPDGKESSYAFALKKGWDKKKDFDDAIKKLKDDGTIDELKKKWWKGECGGSSAGAISSSLPFASIALLGIASAVLLRRL